MNPQLLDNLNGLLTDVRQLVQAWTDTGKKIGMAADAVSNLADMVRAHDIPNAQANIQQVADAAKEIADAVKSFKLTGPMGFHGGAS